MSDKIYFTASVALTSLDSHVLNSVITEETKKKKTHYHHFNLAKAYDFWDGFSTAMKNFMATFDSS